MVGRRARLFGFLGKIRNLIFFRNPKNLATEPLSKKNSARENSGAELVPDIDRTPVVEQTPVIDKELINEELIDLDQ
jgi:hypothetical protein